MSDYSLQATWSTKDALATGQALKAISATELGTEFSAIATAVATKYDSDDIADTATAQALTSNITLISPSGLNDVLGANAGILQDLQALADPNADRILFWDDSAGTTTFLTIGDGLNISATTLALQASVAGAGLAHSAGVLSVNASQGLEISGDDVTIADQAVTSSVPVSLTAGTLGFDLSSITELTMANASISGDGFLMSDAGTLKVMPLDQAGVQVQNVANASQTFALTDANTHQVLTGIATADKTWTIPLNATVAFDIGTVILCTDLDGDGTYDLLIVGDTGVTLTSFIRSASGASGQHTVLAGGTVAIEKVSADEWIITGNIS